MGDPVKNRAVHLPGDRQRAAGKGCGQERHQRGQTRSSPPPAPPGTPGRSRAAAGHGRSPGAGRRPGRRRDGRRDQDGPGAGAGSAAPRLSTETRTAGDHCQLCWVSNGRGPKRQWIRHGRAVNFFTRCEGWRPACDGQQKRTLRLVGPRGGTGSDATSPLRWKRVRHRHPNGRAGCRDLGGHRRCHRGATLGRPYQPLHLRQVPNSCEQCRRVCPAPGGSCGDARRRQ